MRTRVAREPAARLGMFVRVMPKIARHSRAIGRILSGRQEAHETIAATIRGARWSRTHRARLRCREILVRRRSCARSNLRPPSAPLRNASASRDTSGASAAQNTLNLQRARAKAKTHKQSDSMDGFAGRPRQYVLPTPTRKASLRRQWNRMHDLAGIGRHAKKSSPATAADAGAVALISTGEIFASVERDKKR